MLIIVFTMNPNIVVVTISLFLVWLCMGPVFVLGFETLCKCLQKEEPEPQQGHIIVQNPDNTIQLGTSCV